MSTENNTVSLPQVKKQAEKSQLVFGALALGAGLTLPSVAQAELIISDINVTVINGSYELDINGDSTNDLLFIESISSDYGYVKSLTSLSLSTDGKYANMFNNGSVVDETWFDNTNGRSSFGGELYYGTSWGHWRTIGAHGFIGFKFDDLTGNGDRFGWIEVTRGSIILGKMGLQNSYNTAAGVPSSVPEPSSLLLLASGALGLLSLRRRNQLAAEKQTH